jgi:lactate dehydrogenase-like 2-hydroxyacid dehydrogenase
MSKKKLLAFHGNGVLGLDALSRKFDIIRLFEVEDKDAAIDQVKDDVVAINCTVGQFITGDIIKKLPNLEIIATFSVGFDHIDLEAAKERGVKVTNTPNILSAETADTGMALLLATARQIVYADKYTRAGRWEKEGDPPLGKSLTNKKIGIVGLGGIGQKVAKRCEGFEMDVVYFGPREKKDQPYTYYSDLVKMASECDYLMLTCPGGDATKNLVNADVLKALGPEGMLINISRGSVVDQPVLIEALKNGMIKAAGLDVYQDEPHIPSALIEMDNVVLLPHIGSATVETRGAMGQLVVDNILAHFHGEPLITEVNL